ncbi:MAG TPA: VIT domain-containing protein, partial [Kofleriaceae bacterium]|nr:VIT domain-containing protein [Kofleriaceae bacterium]
MLRVWVIAIAALCASTAYAFELPRQAGMYQASGQPLPMVDSSIAVTVRGPLVEVIVTQRFTNRTDHATEATYIFPLPADAAVSAMWIRTGAKTIRAKIAPREEAQQRYEEAVRAGVVAAVLDQERTDIFTQTVAGIAPKSTVEVTLRYDALAHFYDGAWALALPMVVAPRYVAGTATARP